MKNPNWNSDTRQPGADTQDSGNNEENAACQVSGVSNAGPAPAPQPAEELETRTAEGLLAIPGALGDLTRHLHAYDWHHDLSRALALALAAIASISAGYELVFAGARTFTDVTSLCLAVRGPRKQPWRNT